jgi:hypothetical protein
VRRKKRPKTRRLTRNFRPVAPGERDFRSPIYRAWKYAVKTRDGHKCRWPGCSKRTGLTVHHIKKWVAYPELRFVVSNGITLCTRHHRGIKGKEELYEKHFFDILETTFIEMIQELNGKT